MATSQSINERIFAQVETTFANAPNTSGTATVAGGDYIRHTSCQIVPAQADIPSNDKTGGISATRGAPGARSATWNLTFEARPSGAAGTAPDCDPFLQAVFGQPGAVDPGVDVLYTLANAIKSVSIYRFRQPANVIQQCLIGGVVRTLTFNFPQNANCTFELSGSGLWVPDSKNFATLDSTGRGGLTTFPSEPGSPTFAGTPVNSLAGSATIDGNTFQINAMTVRMETAIEIPSDRIFAGQYGSEPERDRLGVFVDLTITDEDTAAVTALHTKAQAGTAINAALVAGTVAGSRIQFNLNNIVLAVPELDDSSRKWRLRLQGNRAYAATSTSLDEFSMKWF